MSSISPSSGFRGKAARVVMAGTLALAFAPALPAFADEAAPATPANGGTIAATADSTQVTTWKDFYKGLGIDTTSGYDAVTSATNFTSHHAKDLPTVVHRAMNAEGATTALDGFDSTATAAKPTVQVKLKAAVYNGEPSSHYTREFAIYPDDTVPGYVWNDYKNSVYAVTVSDGTTTTGAVPWIDYYGENSTRGYHYNKLEVALENGPSIESNEQNVTRFAKFFDGTGALKPGTYTVTVFAKGYSNLTAKIKVNLAYTGTAAATDASKATSRLGFSNLPSDIKNPKVSVWYTVGEGRRAVSTYLAGDCTDNGIYTGATINGDGTVSLDTTKLAAVETGTELNVRVDSDNYATMELKSKVADTATFPNKLAVKSSTKTVRARKLAKKKQTVSALKVTNPTASKLNYKKTSGSKKLSVNAKTGKITIKKGTKKGTYKVKVRVNAAANGEFAAASQTVTAKVKVK